MAHWGVAMSLWHQLWDRPNAATIKRGVAELKKAQSMHPATDREREYISALRAFYRKKGDHDERAKAYSQAMEGVYQRYPSDREAAAFYALSLLASEPEGDTTFANRKKAAAVLEILFNEEPNHPGVAHYLIHSYDKPQLADLGLPAARSYAKSLPLRRMRCICRRIFLRGSGCGRMISIPTWRRSPPRAKPRPCTWAAKGISFMPWISWSMPTCKAVARPMPNA